MKKTLLSILTFSLVSIAFAQVNPKPFVIPELRNWTGTEGKVDINKTLSMNVDASDSKIRTQLNDVTSKWIEELNVMFGIKANVADNSNCDILLQIGRVENSNKEAYEITIGDKIVIKANEPVGILWGTKTILQILEATGGQSLPKGKIVDYPSYPVRGFMLDVGRKFFRIEFLRDYVKFMSYYKMNTFHIHLSDNGFKQYFENDWDKTQAAFRLECDTYPGLAAKDGHYTKKEFVDLQILAEQSGVLIVPEIDIPAHTLAFTRYMPEIGSKEYGMDHLDLFNPKTYQFFDKLFAEYLGGKNPIFRGEYVHIGTDEYSNKDKAVVEKFRYFTDYYIKQVEKYGKKAGVWGAQTHAKGETPIKVKDVLMDCWYNGYADPKAMMDLGYDVVSIPDGWVYIVPAAGYYYDYLNCRNLYNNWTPAKIGNQTFEKDNPKIKGGKFAVWNDHPNNGITEKDVHHRVLPAMQTLSVKMWTGDDKTVSYDDFDKLRLNISEAPGVNIAARHKADESGVVFKKELLKAGDTLPVLEIGYNYRVEFTLRAKNNLNGTILFQSPNAKVYLREPKSGKIGFEREGHVSIFDYVVPNDYSVAIAIEGTDNATRLFVNGQLVESLDRAFVSYSQDGKTRMAKVQTLVFPLEKVGKFTGEITDFTVKYIK